MLLISALLTAGYLLTVSIRAFFKTSEADTEKCEAGWQMLVPLFLLAALVVVLGIFPRPLVNLFDALARSLM